MESSVPSSARPDAHLPESMEAWEVSGHFGAPDRLRLVERAVPVPAPGEVLLRVSACGVCRTDLHCVDGELAPKAPGVVPGHEAIGEVVSAGPGVSRFTIGDRVGIAWLRSTCGECRWCRSGAENLCPRSTYTGWDADGGFAEYAVVPAAFAYRIPPALSDADAAPLLCAGIIGYRALRRAQLPPGVGSGSTASGPAPTSPRRSPSPRGRRCTS